MKQTLVTCMLLLTVGLHAQDSTNIRCKSRNKSGAPCTAVIISKKTGLCNAHNPNRPKCSSKNSKGEPCGMHPVRGTVFCRMHKQKGK